MSKRKPTKLERVRSLLNMSLSSRYQPKDEFEKGVSAGYNMALEDVIKMLKAKPKENG